MKLGTFIKQIRIEKGISQEEVAVKAGLARSYISKLEDNKHKNPSAMVLVKLSNGLGVSYESILEAAGYLESINENNLPPLDVYLRTKYGFEEKAIEEMDFFRKMIKEKYGK